jgi:hypothetical protein
MRGTGHLVHSTGRGNPCGFKPRVTRVRVRVAFFGPVQNPYPTHGNPLVISELHVSTSITICFKLILMSSDASRALLLARATTVTSGHNVTRCHYSKDDDDDDTRRRTTTATRSEGNGWEGGASTSQPQVRLRHFCLARTDLADPSLWTRARSVF